MPPKKIRQKRNFLDKRKKFLDKKILVSRQRVRNIFKHVKPRQTDIRILSFIKQG